MSFRGATTPVGVFDTQAPQVTWGTPVGTTAGELLQVAYTLDEPALLDATLTLADGRELPATVYPDHLELLLPPDASDGLAVLRARVRDAVGNEAIRELVIAVTGIPSVPPQPAPIPAPGWSVPRRRRPREHVVQVRSRVRARSSARVGATRRSRERLIVAGHAHRAGARRATAVVTVRSRALLEPERVAVSVLRASSRASVQRREGPELEALLLGLL